MFLWFLGLGENSWIFSTLMAWNSDYNYSEYYGNGDPADATDVTWTAFNSSAPFPTVTYYVPDAETTPPVFDSAETSEDGTQVLVSLTEDDSPPILPATGITGFNVKVNGVERTIISATASGTIVTLVIANKIYIGDTVTVSYDDDSGNVTDSASNAMVDFSDQSVTNNSTVTRIAKKSVVINNGQLQQLQEGDRLAGDIAFTAANDEDWASPTPATIADAINRIAAEVATLKGSAIS